MDPAAVRIRPSVPADADEISRIYIESAEHHAALDPERYCIPAADWVTERYRDGRQHPQDAESSVTLVAEFGGEVIGFVDVRLTQSPDPMHKQMTYCHIVEIAVSNRHQSQGIGERLLQAAEEWGRGQGAEFASLEYNVANTRAAAFYHERMGYRTASHLAIKRL